MKIQHKSTGQNRDTRHAHVYSGQIRTAIFQSQKLTSQSINAEKPNETAEENQTKRKEKFGEG